MGTADPEKAELWVQEVEMIFAVLNTPEESKLGYASYLLLGDAEYWWRGARQMLEANQEDVSWNTFKRVFLEKYFPVSAQEAKETQFLTLKQGVMSVAEYASKLESLAKHFRFFRNQVDEAYMCARFLSGLRYEVERGVRSLGIRRFQELVARSVEVEEMENTRGTLRGSGGPVRTNCDGHKYTGKRKDFRKKPYPQSQRKGKAQGQGTKSGNQGAEREVTCYQCGQRGHYASQCRGEITCYQCKQTGHIAKDCKQAGAKATRNTATESRPKAQARVYALSGLEAVETEGLIQRTGEIAGNTLTVVFDSGATHSFVSQTCAERLNLSVSSLMVELVISTPSGETIVANFGSMCCTLVLEGRPFLSNLICLPLKDLDVILGMDCVGNSSVEFESHIG